MIDIGSNLTNPKLHNNHAELEKLVATSRQHGLTSIITIGTNVAESELSLQLAKQYQGFIYATAGIHPHYAGAIKDSEWAALTHLISQPEVVAAGEMGLDFCRNFSARNIQIEVFEKQLAANQPFQKPLFLHERDAFSKQAEILKANRLCFSSGVAHCFTGNTDMLKAYLELDLHIGITGWICDERRGKEVAEAVKYIPRDRLLVETDSPFLLPRTLRPKPKDGINRPWYIKEVISKIAQCRNETPAQVAAVTTQNAMDLFQFPVQLS